MTIYYPNAGAYSIYNDQMQLIDSNDWDNALETWSEPTGAGGCGENRYEGVINRLEFWMTPGCDIRIVPRDALMLGIRMEWTMDEFFADGGTTAFADRLAGILGIHSADIKVVSVYEGSVVVEFQVFSPDDDLEELKKIDQIFRDKITEPEAGLSDSVFLGAPILGAISNNDPFFIKDGTYNEYKDTIKRQYTEERIQEIEEYELNAVTEETPEPETVV